MMAAASLLLVASVLLATERTAIQTFAAFSRRCGRMLRTAASLAGRAGSARGDRWLGTKAGARRRKHEERARCLDELPELIDVVALGMGAGISFDAALGIYCDRYATMLAQRLGDAMRSWRLGICRRREALRSVADDLAVDEFTVFVESVTRSLEFGAPLAGTLVSQASAVREARRGVVEERIEKTPVKMLIPTGTLILPAMLLAILGPLVASMASGG